MAAHNPEDSAGAQIAMMVALGALLRLHQGNPVVGHALEQGMEAARAGLLASPSEERKLQAFEEVAEVLLAAFNSPS